MYKNEAIQELLKDGEYRLRFTIYTLPAYSHTGQSKEGIVIFLYANKLSGHSLSLSIGLVHFRINGCWLVYLILILK